MTQPRVITIHMKTSFMKPSTGLLEVHGKVLSHSRSVEPKQLTLTKRDTPS
jgi:hypothetical protein